MLSPTFHHSRCEIYPSFRSTQVFILAPDNTGTPNPQILIETRIAPPTGSFDLKPGLTDRVVGQNTCAHSSESQFGRYGVSVFLFLRNTLARSMFALTPCSVLSPRLYNLSSAYVCMLIMCMYYHYHEAIHAVILYLRLPLRAHIVQPHLAWRWYGNATLSTPDKKPEAVLENRSHFSFSVLAPQLSMPLTILLL